MKIKISTFFLISNLIYFFLLVAFSIYCLGKNLEELPFYIKYFFIIQYVNVIILYFVILKKRRILICFNYEYLMLLFWLYLIIHIFMDIFLEKNFVIKYFIQNFIILNSWIIIYFSLFIVSDSFIKKSLKIVNIISISIILLIIYFYLYGNGIHTSNQIFLLIFSILLFTKFNIKKILLLFIFIIISIISNARGTLLDMFLLILFRVFFNFVVKNITFIIFLGFILILFLTFNSNYLNSYDLSLQSRILGLIGMLDYYKNNATIFNYFYGLGIGGGFEYSFDVGIKAWSDGIIRKLENTYGLIFMQLGILGLILFLSIYILFFNTIKFYLKFYYNNPIYKGMLLFFIIELITFFRVDATGDFLFLIPFLMIIFRIFFLRVKVFLKTKHET